MSPYKAYITWKVKLLTPQDPKTLEEFMTKYNLTPQDITSFQETDSYEDDLRKASLLWLQSKIPELLHIAYKEARESKSVSDIEKIVEMAHSLKKKGESSNNQFNFFNLDESRFKQIASRYTGEASVLGEGSSR
jgi:hypothetical protein